jgi:branched-chain amino acid transport system ATP-binding protein
VIDRIVDMGMTVLIVEQNIVHTLKIADRGYVLENGEITMTGTGKDLLENPHIKKAYLGI